MRRGAESGQTRSCGRAFSISRRLRLQFLDRQALLLGLAARERGRHVALAGIEHRDLMAFVDAWHADRRSSHLRPSF